MRSETVNNGRRGGGRRWLESDAAAARWLREYGRAERQLEDRTTFVEVVAAARSVGLTAAVEVLLDAIGNRRRIRPARTDRHRIGSYIADCERLILRDVLMRPLLRRMTVVAAVCAGLAALVLPMGTRDGVQLGVLAVALLVVGRRDVPAIVLLCLAGSVSIVVDLNRWWWCLLGLLAGWNLISYLKLRGMLRPPWWAKGPVLGILPRRIRLRLLLTRRSALFANAIDLASSARAELAGPFVSACRDVPAALQPMIEICQALVAFDGGDVRAALTLAAHATASDRAMPATVRGWCLGQLSDILGQSGNPTAGQRRHEAIELLRPRSCRRYARALRTAEIQEHITQWPLRDAVAVIHRYRRIALRSRDFDLLHLTEMWLTRLMIASGDVEDAAVLLEELVGGDDGRVAMFSGRDETANDLLLRAGVQIGRLDRARTDPRRDVLVALAMLDANTRPLAATAGHLLLAKLERAAGAPDTALAYAASALSAAQHGRYMLPSAGWREFWSRVQLDAHATALAFAAAGPDSELVAEVIEVTRGEVLPAVSDARTLSALVALDATATDTPLIGTREPGAEPSGVESDGASAVLVLQGLSPVRQPPRIRIGSGLRLPGLDGSLEEIPLDREITSIAPCTWYWSAATVLDVYYWAVRDPAGVWTHGTVAFGPDSPAAAAYADLLDALPFARAGDDAQTIRARIMRGPLARGATPEAERTLLARVAAAFLPPTLVEELRSGPDGATLVVSLPTALGHLPVAGLPLGPDTDLRVVERAAVVHMPSWGIVHTARRTRTGQRPQRWPARMAIVAPHGGNDMDLLTRPGGVQRVIRGPVSKTDLRNVLHAVSGDRAWLLTLIGHVDPVPGNAAASGLRLAATDGTDERLTMNDLVTTRHDDRPFELPERVVLIGCGSIGLGDAPDLTRDRTPTSEWLGLGSAVVLAGATHVCCTLYTVYANNDLKRMTDSLIAGLEEDVDAVRSLRRVQLAELARWRDGRQTWPVLWLSLAYVGVGCTMVRTALAEFAAIHEPPASSAWPGTAVSAERTAKAMAEATALFDRLVAADPAAFGAARRRLAITAAHLTHGTSIPVPPRPATGLVPVSAPPLPVPAQEPESQPTRDGPPPAAAAVTATEPVPPVVTEPSEPPDPDWLHALVDEAGERCWTLRLALIEARRLGHAHFGPEHLLIAALRDGGCAAAVESLGVPVSRLRDTVAGWYRTGAAAPIELDPAVRMILRSAAQEAIGTGADRILPAHLLLAVLRTGDGVGAALFDACGADRDEASVRLVAGLIGPALQACMGPLHDAGRAVAGHRLTLPARLAIGHALDLAAAATARFLGPDHLIAGAEAHRWSIETPPPLPVTAGGRGTVRVTPAARRALAAASAAADADGQFGIDVEHLHRAAAPREPVAWPVPDEALRAVARRACLLASRRRSMFACPDDIWSAVTDPAVRGDVGSPVPVLTPRAKHLLTRAAGHPRPLEHLRDLAEPPMPAGERTAA